MKKIFVVVLAVFAIGAQAKEYKYVTVPNDPMNARIYTLDNGLTVYLTQNAEKPEIQTVIAVRAGGQNDPKESTGLAHYQEHIMFKGTKSYGTSDYVAEKPNLDAIDSLYEVYGRTIDAEARRAIYHQIDSFSYEGSKIAIANEFDKLMSLIGATGVNAFTANDRTCYIEVIPSGELRRWAMIESDRFQNLVVRGFHTELETVYEEFNMYSTRDQGKVMLAIDQMLYPDVPYRQHEVIGTAGDLKNPSLKNIKHFYSTFYRPNNVAVCLSGDLDFDHAIAVIDEYFGAWKATDIPAFEVPEQAPLSAPKDSVVIGQESPQVWMGWRFPAITDKDIDVVDIIAEVLSNGKCGLIDLDLVQRQLLLWAAAMPFESNDYSTFFLMGAPKDGQELTEVRNLLLGEIDKLKKGDFSEDILHAIINNKRRSDMEELQSNRARAFKFVTSYVYKIPYEDIVKETDRMAAITKADIVRVANRYFTDGYATVFKQQGDDKNVETMEKPHITPIEMNRDKNSAFCTELAGMESERLQPQFLDFEKDLQKSTLKKGQELLYRQNKENGLFRLEFIVNKGIQSDPLLQMVRSYLEYLGSKKMPAEAYQMMLYALASDMYVYSADENTCFGIYGLQENFEATLALLEDKVLNAQPDEAVYQELVRDLVKAHEDEKSNQQANFYQLTTYGLYGAETLNHMTLTPEQMQQYSGADLLEHLRALLPQIARVTYYGPATEKELTKALQRSQFIKAGNARMRAEDSFLPKQVVNDTEIWLAPFDAPNIYFRAYANWGEVYNAKDEAIIRLFNEYFDGSMGGIVFQEMREARALAYAAGASYSIPSHQGDNYIFSTYIISQNDKLQDCMETFDSICNNLPLSQSAFDKAKTALLKQIEKRRFVRDAAINAYVAYEKKGWDHDWFEDIYREVQHLTLDDVVAFQKAHVADRTYRFLILGNEKELDMHYLESKGTVRRLTTQDIFVY